MDKKNDKMQREVIRLMLADQATLKPGQALHIREAAAPVQQEGGEGEKKATGRTIEGFAIVFGQPSVVIDDWWDGPMREYVDDGAIDVKDMVLWDVKMTAFHDREILLARHWPGGGGTLKMEVRQGEGLWVSFEAPNSPWGDNILESVRRGDMKGMSFSFYRNMYEYKDSIAEDQVTERHITKLMNVFETTVASDPAYPSTTASAREAAAKREKEEREKAEAEAAKQKADEETAAREAVATVAALRELAKKIG